MHISWSILISRHNYQEITAHISQMTRAIINAGIVFCMQNTGRNYRTTAKTTLASLSVSRWRCRSSHLSSNAIIFKYLFWICLVYITWILLNLKQSRPSGDFIVPRYFWVAYLIRIPQAETTIYISICLESCAITISTFIFLFNTVRHTRDVQTSLVQINLNKFFCKSTVNVHIYQND